MYTQESQKGIKQFKVKCSAYENPAKYVSPYELLALLNDSIKGKYDVEFIEVRYKINNTKAQLSFVNNSGALWSGEKLQIDEQFNHIFGDLAMQELQQEIFGDAIKLEAPKDFDPSMMDNIQEAQKLKEEEKKIEDVDKGVDLIMKVVQPPKVNSGRRDSKMNLRTIQLFKCTQDKSIVESEVEILVKGRTTQPAIDRIQQEKNSKKPIEIRTSGRTLKLYLHPISGDMQSAENLVDMSRVTGWAMCTIPEETSPAKNSDKSQNGFYYFDTQKIQENVETIMQSIKISSSLSLKESRDGIIEGFDLFTFLFNELVLKVSVNLGQVHKIARIVQQNRELFYFHLKYPPRYFLTILKKDQACSESYLKNWERLQNFPMLRRQLIRDNDLLRLYLFNNSVLVISLENDPHGNYSIKQSLKKMEMLVTRFEGIYPCVKLSQPINFSLSIRVFEKEFNYKYFLGCLQLETLEQRDKVWKVKYFILIMVRYNLLSPKEVIQLLKFVQEHRDKLDIILFILWKTAVSMWGYQSTETRFYNYLIKEFEEIRQLGSQTILRRLSTNTELIAHIFRASLTPSGYLFNPPTPEMKGRLLKQFSNESQFFMRVTICDDSEATLKNQKYITKVAFRKTMNEIRLINRTYIPLGWSPSQLRSYSIWYMHQVEQPRANLKRMSRQHILSFLGSFESIKNPARKAARIGQSFSASWTFKVSGVKQIIEEDVKTEKGFLFTDGIGKISKDLLDKMSLKLNLKHLSLIQMRYKGAKGVLVMDTSLPNNTIVMRKSLIKYDCFHETAKKYLDILDWNKYKPGFLNRQIIILLRTLGIRDQTFRKLQDEHIQKIESLSFKDCSIFKQLQSDLNTDICNLEPANQIILQLLRAGFTLEQQPFFRGVLETLKRNGLHQLKMKSSIRIDKSARIIGIVDQYDVLKENQVYCSVMDPFADFDYKAPKVQNIEGDVIVTRNPCLNPADIRKLRCIGNESIKARFLERGHKQNLFEPYVNSVIFPMKGQIPITAQISGSDLDGDNFWICWDDRLIPKSHYPPVMIDDPGTASNQKNKEDEVTYEQMLDFFIDYVNYEKLGQIDNSHLIHADQDEQNYANNKICIQLANIHGKAVDFPKTGYCPPVNSKLLVSIYPDFMEKQEQEIYNSKSILGILYRLVKDKIRELLTDQKIAGQVDRDLLKFTDLNFEKYEIIECFKVLKEYERDLRNLAALIGVDTEYEIYTGNFSTAKEKVASFGKNRLIATIIHLRTRFFDRFFEDFVLEKEVYTDAKDYQLDKEVFSQLTRRKAILYYLVSYIYKFCKFENVKGDEQFQSLCGKVIEALQECGVNLVDQRQAGRFCGFVWFVVPKVIINVKNMNRKKEKRQKQEKVEIEMEQMQNNGEQKKEEPEQIINSTKILSESFKRDEYDEGQI